MSFLLYSLRVPLSWPEIFRRTFYEAFWKDNGLAMAAQLAYYFFFALFPALLFIVALASYFPPGSIFATALWLAGSLGFKYYVANWGNYTET